MSINWLAEFEAWYIMKKKHNIIQIDYVAHLSYIRVRYYVTTTPSRPKVLGRNSRIIEEDLQLKEFISKVLMST